MISAIDANNPNPFRASASLDIALAQNPIFAPIHFNSERLALDIEHHKILVSLSRKSTPVKIRFDDIKNIILFTSWDENIYSYYLKPVLKNLEAVEMTNYEADIKSENVRNKMWEARQHITAYLEEFRRIQLE